MRSGAARGRFASIIAALSLIVFLVLTLGALADGLFFGATGAVRSTNATGVRVRHGRQGLAAALEHGPPPRCRGRRTPRAWPRRAAWASCSAAGTAPAGEYDVAVFGVDPEGAGVPTSIAEGRLPEAGENGIAAIDEELAKQGVPSAMP